MRFQLSPPVGAARRLSSITARWSLALLLATGCGSRAPVVKPKTDQARIKGVVTNGGQAIPANSEVVFHHKSEGCTIATRVDAQGRYTLAAADPRVGIPVGSYEVAVRPPVIIAPQEQVKPGDAEYEKRMKGAPEQVSQPASDQIPEKFYKFETSGITLEATINDNVFDVDLSKY